MTQQHFCGAKHSGSIVTLTMQQNYRIGMAREGVHLPPSQDLIIPLQ